MRSGNKKVIYTGAGWAFVGLGTVGAFLPVLPTTCFMIAALWCFTRGNPERAERLLGHPRYGASLRAWVAKGVIPRRIKAIAVSSMAASVAIVAAAGASPTTVAIVGGILAVVGTYVITRPSDERKEIASCT